MSRQRHAYAGAIPVVAMALLMVLAVSAAARPKTDRIILRNGDHITAEIKGLGQGKLNAKTDDMGTVSIEWDEIAGLHSSYYYQVTTAGGDIFFGSIELSDSSEIFRITMLDAVAGIQATNVVQLTPIEESFWSRLDGSLSLGFDFTKASNVAQFIFDFTSIYKGGKNVANFDLATIYTNNRGEDYVSRRVDVGLGLHRLLGRKKWFAWGTGGYQRNDELSLKNRYLFATGGGWNALHTNWQRLNGNVGFAFNTEEADSVDQRRESLEAVIAVSYSLFDYDSPKTDANVSLEYYPSLTESTRYRIEFDGRVRREIVSDFFIELRYYTSADTKSPATGGWKSDYGTVLSVSFTY